MTFRNEDTFEASLFGEHAFFDELVRGGFDEVAARRGLIKRSEVCIEQTTNREFCEFVTHTSVGSSLFRSHVEAAGAGLLLSKAR